MMRLAGTAVAAILSLSAVSANAQILTGQILYSQRHGYWTSFLLVFPKSANTRASTTPIDGTQTALNFDFTPPSCKPSMDFLLPFNSSASKDNVRSDVLVTTRTDNGERISLSAASIVTMGDKYGLVFVPNSTNLLGQIGEMSRGQVLRVKFTFGGDEQNATYNTYSLIGLTAAYRRAEQMCVNPSSIRR